MPTLPPQPPSIEFGDLRSFLVLADLLDFGHAAESLGMSEAALSATIRALERNVAVPLVRRHSETISLTDAGLRFAEQSRRLLAGLDLAVSEARRAGGMAAAIRIGWVPDMPVQRLTAFLGGMYERDPGLQFEVLRMRTAEQLRRLHVGELDLGVVHDAGAVDAIDVTPLWPGEPLDVHVTLGHRLAAAEAVGHAELEHETLLVSPRGADPALADRLRALFDAAGLSFGEVLETRSADPTDLLFAVAEGRGVAIAPRSAGATIGEVGTLVASRPLEPSLSMPDTMLATRADGSPELAAVLAEARAVARGLYG
jgi:DNA-binding transcriptional LysR family regulator